MDVILGLVDWKEHVSISRVVLGAVVRERQDEQDKYLPICLIAENSSFTCTLNLKFLQCGRDNIPLVDRPIFHLLNYNKN